MASFFKKDKRFFHILVDSTFKVLEGHNIHLICSSISNLIKENLKDKDLFTITRFDEDVHTMHET
jgi:hypothetical protein